MTWRLWFLTICVHIAPCSAESLIMGNSILLSPCRCVCMFRNPATRYYLCYWCSTGWYSVELVVQWPAHRQHHHHHHRVVSVIHSSSCSAPAPLLQWLLSRPPPVVRQAVPSPMSNSRSPTKLWPPAPKGQPSLVPVLFGLYSACQFPCHSHYYYEAVL